MKSAKYTIKEVVQAFRELYFEEGTCSINRCIQNRMYNKDISKIMNIQRPDISLVVCSLLQLFQPTTASLEKIFSMLQKLLSKDRKFEIKNMKKYMILHFSSCTW